MATATATALDVSSPSYANSFSSDDDAGFYANTSSPSVSSFEGEDSNMGASSNYSTVQSAEDWASLFRRSFNALYNGERLGFECLKAPRRNHAGA